MCQLINNRELQLKDTKDMYNNLETVYRVIISSFQQA